MANELKIKEFLLKREKKIRCAKNNLWEFCKILHSYKESWTHLKIMCETLQNFYENKLFDINNKPYRKLMINLPPRHYKTRTMILFCCWILGKNIEETIISTSYSDDLATEFSRYTRDEIQREKNKSYDINFNDIFPKTKTQEGNASYSKWALEGKHFTYLGAGFGASITGKGCKIAIIDDQIKSYEDANNEESLNKKWEWYLGTFKSRMEEGSKQIIIMTRWINKDICGRLLSDEIESKQWYVLKMPAYNQEKDEMLCSDMLSKESYLEFQRTMPDDVFSANYNQEPIEKKGLLYQRFLEYEDLPKNDNKILQDRRIAYIDTADEGNDYLVCICGLEYKNVFYCLDILCTKAPQEITENKTVDLLIKNDIKDVLIESNNGGRAFARNIIRILKEKKRYDIIIKWFHQSNNKMARIFSNASNVENRVLYPKGWNYLFPEYHKLIKSFMRNKNNQVDDPEDCITGIIEMIDKKQIITSSNISAGDLGL